MQMQPAQEMRPPYFQRRRLRLLRRLSCDQKRWRACVQAATKRMAHRKQTQTQTLLPDCTAILGQALLFAPQGTYTRVGRQMQQRTHQEVKTSGLSLSMT